MLPLTFHLSPLTCHLSPVTYPAFENPGHTGHMCLATFEIRQPTLAEPKAQPDIFPKELAWPQAHSVISVLKAFFLASIWLLQSF